MIVDIYTHIFPSRAFERMGEMDAHGDYRQIVSLPNPPIEDITTPGDGNELARIVKAGYAVPPDVVARLKTMVGFGGKK